jgi:hypothetical protein
MQERTGLEVTLLLEQKTKSNDYNLIVLSREIDQDEFSRAKNDNAKTYINILYCFQRCQLLYSPKRMKKSQL